MQVTLTKPMRTSWEWSLDSHFPRDSVAKYLPDHLYKFSQTPLVKITSFFSGLDLRWVYLTKMFFLFLAKHYQVLVIVRFCRLRLRMHFAVTGHLSLAVGLLTWKAWKWDKVFKNGSSEICQRQPLKKFDGLLKQNISFQIF